MLARHIVICLRGYVVCLAFTNKRVVFQQVLDFGGVELGLFLEDVLGFVSASERVRCLA